jgi:hypothetical protein
MGEIKMKKPLNVRIDSELLKKIKKKSVDKDKKIYEVVEELLNNKIYLLLVIDDNREIDIEEYAKEGTIKRLEGPVEDWILNHDIGIHSISGFKLNEEEAKLWAKERCERGEELPNEPVSETIVPFEKYIYVDSKCVLVEEPNRMEKHVKFKGFRREGLELPIFGYIELLERPNK